MEKLEIIEKGDNIKHTFEVKDKHNLSREEVKMICTELNTPIIFVMGKIYNVNH